MKNDLFEYALTVGESKIHLKSDKRIAIREAVKEIKRLRRELVLYIKGHPEFQYSLSPLEASPEAPRIVRDMVRSSKIAKVGPMASVAGTIADLGLEAMLRKGAKTAIVEDGGEIAGFTEQQVSILVSILSSDTSLSGKLGFRISREDCPIGIATSSSKTGHALSFGEADSVTVVASSASLADAAATAICNSVVGTDIEESIQQGLKRAETIEGVRGVIIIREGHTGLWGRLPKIVRVR